MKRKWLTLLRIDKDLTQKEVALKIGVSPKTYSFIENGGQSVSVSQAKKIADVLDFDWTYFFCEGIKYNLIFELPKRK
ncbi:helix-turn-helix transcriptional regulator [Bacillus sp. AF23]|uniref:helix-turn-helix transcriptional regulator n=1 Tax=Bacillus sp. AF23 TaxID=2821151 RepID=UPI001E52117C|nr:helix-turn-helix transcriptional regulator [Bacillus sp. AF23]MCC8350730.1 helix-turn-helix domain-containing protein [Bacillus sp. AF23]